MSRLVDEVDNASFQDLMQSRPMLPRRGALALPHGFLP
ncbi:hypothetical protein DUNSADRAFT_14915 [Dunaliella salina]|uniref:Uncharacterized protein n=1 Tax=Dunaliella salina TaxID=3046 RepID=A0ABQ7G6J7_DUNSA|nr:hypothetical protein DUNSADRAFT_14915 [Dunaliella salina]|eukprot:KAF5830185.1 hypothetical protein DUNSADRAFT_14915 [Dunaliella salina]